MSIVHKRSQILVALENRVLRVCRRSLANTFVFFFSSLWPEVWPETKFTQVVIINCLFSNQPWQS